MYINRHRPLGDGYPCFGGEGVWKNVPKMEQKNVAIFFPSTVAKIGFQSPVIVAGLVFERQRVLLFGGFCLGVLAQNVTVARRAGGGVVGCQVPPLKRGIRPVL